MHDDISRSQKKRDVKALEKLGRQLTSMRVARLQAAPLSGSLRAELIDAKRLQRTALRRYLSTSIFCICNRL